MAEGVCSVGRGGLHPVWLRKATGYPLNSLGVPTCKPQWEVVGWDKVPFDFTLLSCF